MLIKVKEVLLVLLFELVININILVKYLVLSRIALKYLILIKFLKKNFFYKTKITPYGKPIIDCPLENEEKLENFKELLNISLNLEICIILLIFYTLLILIFTNLAKKELKLN